MVAKRKKLRANGSIHLLLCRSAKAPYVVLLSLTFVFLIYMNYVSRLIVDLAHGASTSLPWQDAVAPARKSEKAMSYKDTIKEYIPASCEKYIVEHAEKLGYGSTKVWTTDEHGLDLARGCAIWSDPKISNEDVYNSLHSYLSDLDKYNEAMKNFEPIPDLFDEIREGNYDACLSTRVHPDGLSALFPSKQLSLSKSGYVEPITPPMRSYKGMCISGGVMDLDYLIHDFEAMCRNLKPTSRRVFIDLGASLDHGTGNPVGWLLGEYEKFGFRFDHIYGFEIEFAKPEDVYGHLLDEKYFAAYHWINVGVNHKEGDRLNPLNSILQKFKEDDFIVLKLDIDINTIELPLAHQLLAGGVNGTYHRLIDQFYFEHHVHLSEIAYAWNETMVGTMKDSLDLFYGLRSKGIPAHFWP